MIITRILAAALAPFSGSLMTLSSLEPVAQPLVNQAHRETCYRVKVVTGKLINSIAFGCIYPPETATQRNVRTDFDIVPLSGAKVPEGVLERREVFFTCGGRQQKGLLILMESADPKNVLADGYKVVMRSIYDSYRFAGLQGGGDDSGGSFVGATPTADFQSPAFRDFVAKIGLPNQFDVNDARLDTLFIQAAGSVKYSRGLRQEQVASRVIARGGDCGSHSSLLEALYLSVGVPARMAVGFCLLQGKSLEPHAWVEALRSGSWTPIEATNGDAATNPLRSVGRREQCFVMHFGLGAYCEFRDSKGRRCVFETDAFQDFKTYTTVLKGGSRNNGDNKGSTTIQIVPGDSIPGP